MYGESARVAGASCPTVRSMSQTPAVMPTKAARMQARSRAANEPGRNVRVIQHAEVGRHEVTAVDHLETGRDVRGAHFGLIDRQMHLAKARSRRR